MKHRDIDLIRDTALKIEDKYPRQAYDLLKLALKNRPDGALIKKHLIELKRRLNISSFFIIGNCQSDLFAKAILSRNKNFDIDNVILAHLWDNNIGEMALLDTTDYIITQQLAPKFGELSTSNIIKKFGDKVVTVSNIYFEGFHSDWCYIPVHNQIRLQSPIGDYHNRTILHAYIEGVSESEALRRFTSVTYNSEHYALIPDLSLEELKSRETSVDIPISDLIQKNFERGNCCFHTFNHPKAELFDAYVSRILDFINLEHHFKPLGKECLDKVKLRTNPAINCVNHNVTIRNNSDVDMKDFIYRSYQIYKDNPEHVNAYKLKQLHVHKNQ